MVAEQFYFSFEIGNLFLNSSSGPTQSELVIILLKHVVKEIMQIAGSLPSTLISTKHSLTCMCMLMWRLN